MFFDKILAFAKHSLSIIAILKCRKQKPLA